MTVLTEFEQVTPEWLSRIVGSKVASIEFELRMQGNSRIRPLTVTYTQPTDAPTHFILKLSARGNHDSREVEFYSSTTAHKDLPIIRCYDAAWEAGQFHILMEDLRLTHDSHPPSFLPPSIANAERIVDALARFHTFWWDSDRLPGTLPSENSIRQRVMADIDLLPSFYDFLGDRLSDKRRGIFERVSTHLLDLKLERLLSKQNITLIHEDLHAGNFLYPRDPERDTIRFIDWKSWSINPCANDMANLMAVYWTQERRNQLQDRLLRRYFERLLEHGIVDYTWDTCWQDYRTAVIGYLFFPIWQWSVGTPDFIWWHNFDRLMMAYLDLSCEELI